MRKLARKAWPPISRHRPMAKTRTRLSRQLRKIEPDVVLNEKPRRCRGFSLGALVCATQCLLSAKADIFTEPISMRSPMLWTNQGLLMFGVASIRSCSDEASSNRLQHLCSRTTGCLLASSFLTAVHGFQLGYSQLSFLSLVIRAGSDRRIIGNCSLPSQSELLTSRIVIVKD